MSRKIFIRFGTTEMSAELNDSPTASALFTALPLSARANTWGDEIYFQVPVDRKLDSTAAETVQAGDSDTGPRAGPSAFSSVRLRSAGELKFALRAPST